MNDLQRDIHSTVFSLLILALAAYVGQRFFLPLAWAGILCIATWPLYERMLAWSRGRTALAAALLTAGMACVFVIPTLLGVSQAVREAPALANFVADANNNGIAPPAMLQRLPIVGEYVERWWQDTLSQPHGLTHLLSEGSGPRLMSASAVLKALGGQIFHRLVDFAFAFLCLFFFYLDGKALNAQLMRIGGRWFGQLRWDHYHQKVPTAIRATVNGLVLVGLGEGLLIGIGYAFAGLSSPALWGALTGMLAIVPFGAPLAYLSAALLLAAGGNMVGAVAVAVWGTLVLFVADHFIRPTIIGNATRLPFLAVLFGILGGVETLGLVGLFIGPVVMVLLVSLWREADSPVSA
ncbi:MAG: AI-2E family transporter [Pseudomonadota bacterium]